MSALSESEIFQSDNARMVRAGLWMLEGAWRSPIPGSVPASFSALSQVTRLTVAEVTQNFDLLTAGWTLQEDGRLHHAQLEALAESVQERFGNQLAVIAESAAVTCQGGAIEFELMPTQEVAKKKQRGKTAFPRDFKMDRTTLAKAIAAGFYTDELQQWLIEDVRVYSLANDRRQSNWQMALVGSMSNEFVVKRFKAKFGYPLGLKPSTEIALDSGSSMLTPRQRLAQFSGVSAVGPKSFAQIGAERNSILMAQSIAIRAASAAAAQVKDEMSMQPAFS